MKRYETMSKEEIMNFFWNCEERNCDHCVAEPPSEAIIKGTVCAYMYLYEDMPEPLMVRRYQNICCKQDLDEALGHVRQECDDTNCSVCKYCRVRHCMTRRFIDYLCELEPEREKEWYLDEKYNKSRKQEA